MQITVEKKDGLISIKLKEVMGNGDINVNLTIGSARVLVESIISAILSNHDN